MDDDLGALDGVARRRRVAQVVLGGADDADLGAELAQLAHDHAAEEAGAAGDGDRLVLPERGRLRAIASPSLDRARPASWSSSAGRRRRP